MTLHLMSHVLCPYVQRAAISLAEKDVAFERTDIDLANKPAWFLAISPLGKTPVLSVGQQSVFESAAILEYLEETQPKPLHPADPMTRAQHRGWIEFGSSVLNDIAGFYAAVDADVFAARITSLSAKFARLEAQLIDGPYFAGSKFSLVDAVFGPVFRYFDTFDTIADFGILTGKPKVQAWRAALAVRPSVRDAVPPNYPDLLGIFLLNRKSHLSALMRDRVAA
ncbi:MAG: glutathione S-transferase family protein [Alphaproteobacteria bacterium]|nr:glutathione S-transferase family protein [Alphaproteobacteria bacterium]